MLTAHHAPGSAQNWPVVVGGLSMLFVGFDP